MKRFLMYCVVLVVMLFMGFTTYYFVANREQIALAFDQSQSLCLNVGETFALNDILSHKDASKSTKIKVSITDQNILAYDADKKQFSANSAGNCILKIKPSNTKFGPYVINVRVGNGLTTEYPLFINTAQELASIGANGSVWTANLNYELIADIYLTNIDWTPLTTSGFNGSFNGAWNTIYNLTMTTSNNVDFGGLFSKVNASGIIKNTNFVDANLQGTFKSLGIVAGVNKGIICNIDISSSTLINNSNIGATGAIVGTNDIDTRSASVGMCGVQTTSITAGGYVGGLVGKNNGGVIENSYAVLTSFTAKSSAYFGGIAGQNLVTSSPSIASTIKNTHAGCLSIINSGTTSGITAYVNDQSTGFKNIYTRNYYTLATDNLVGTSSGGLSASNIEKKTLAQIKNKSTYIEWDFSSIWKMGNEFAILNYKTPYIKASTPITPVDPELPVTPTDPVIDTSEPVEGVSDLYQMVCEMQSNPNSGKTYVVNTSQTANMTIAPWSTAEWNNGSFSPIGTKERPFTCKFMVASGVSVVFANLKIENEQYAGFLGYVGSGAIISGFTFQNSIIKNNSTSVGSSTGFTGVVAGYVSTGASIINCKINGMNIDAYDNVGAIAGVNNGAIQNCVVETSNNSIAVNSASNNAGGIVGNNSGTIYTSKTNSVKISVGSSAGGNVGGIAGVNSGLIVSALAESGTISSDSANILRVGGISGTNNNVIRSSLSKNMKISISLNSNNSYAGGISASNASGGSILQCNVYAPNISAYYAGGLATDNFGKITNSNVGSESFGLGVVGGNITGGLAVWNNIGGYIGNCGVFATLEGLTNNSNTNGFAYGLKDGSNIENCFSSATLTGKGNHNADTDTPYRNWLSNAISNLPLSERMGTITNSLLVNVSNKYIQGYGLVVDWFPNDSLSRYDIVISAEVAKGSDNFAKFLNKGFTESNWTFVMGKLPVAK